MSTTSQNAYQAVVFSLVSVLCFGLRSSGVCLRFVHDSVGLVVFSYTFHNLQPFGNDNFSLLTRRYSLARLQTCSNHQLVPQFGIYETPSPPFVRKHDEASQSKEDFVVWDLL